MKKKPALQEILDNLDSYSDEEIENLKDQPKWIREQLLGRKNGTIDNRSEAERREAAERLADEMMKKQGLL